LLELFPVRVLHAMGL